MLSVILSSLHNNKEVFTNTHLMVLCFSAVSFTPDEVFEGDKLILNCNVTPKTTVSIGKWEQNGSPVTSNSRMQTYTVNKVSQKDAGTWSCLIGNKPTVVKASTSFQVKGAVFSSRWLSNGRNKSCAYLVYNALIPT